MYLIEQFPMVCLGCLENKYFPRDLIFGAGKNATEPSGTVNPLNYTLPGTVISIFLTVLRSLQREQINPLYNPDNSTLSISISSCNTSEEPHRICSKSSSCCG